MQHEVRGRVRWVIAAALVASFVAGVHAQADGEDGLKFLTVKEGEGAGVQRGDEIVLHESTSLMDGTLIFSSFETGQPIRICIGGGQVIDGLERAVTGMRPGEVRYAVVPPHLSKRQSYPDSFGPDDTLSYKLELVAISGKDCVDKAKAAAPQSGDGAQ